MTINPSGWRPEMSAAEVEGPGSWTGNRALMLEEPLIFELAGSDTTGVDFDTPSALKGRALLGIGALARSAPIGLPGL